MVLCVQASKQVSQAARIGDVGALRALLTAKAPTNYKAEVR